MSEAIHTAVDPDEVVRRTVSWAAELLEDPDVTAADNFLDLGGHSMLALELSRLVEKHFGAELDMELVFERSLGAAAADAARRAGA